MHAPISPRTLLITGLLLAFFSALLMFGYSYLLNCIVTSTDFSFVDYMSFVYGKSMLPLAIFILIGVICAVVGYVSGASNKWLAVMVVFLAIYLVSSITLSLLSFFSPHSRAPTAAIKAGVSALRAHAEDYFNVHGNYGPYATSCTQSGSMFAETAMVAGITRAEKSAKFSAECFSDGKTFAVAVPIAPGLYKEQGLFCPQVPEVDRSGLEHYCVDSTGFAGTIMGPLTSTQCPGVRQ